MNQLPANDSYGVLSNQLLRCGSLIGVNIAKAKAAADKKSSRRYIEKALVSANEITYWLALTYNILDHSNNRNSESIIEVMNEVKQLSAQIQMRLRSL